MPYLRADPARVPQWQQRLGHLARPRVGIAWSGNHTQALSFGAPLLVLDMYEHAYQLDFGAAAAQYLEAFWGNIDWAAVDRRYRRAVKAWTALRS